MINTYGVFGKIEFVMGVQIGNQSVTVDFSGGSTSLRGVVPATYVTNNPLVQRALHMTPEFRLGIVQLIKSVPEAIDLAKAEREEAVVDECAAVDEVANGGERVEVSCLDDAVEWLKCRYEGYSASKLRTKAAVLKAGEEHGVVFVGL